MTSYQAMIETTLEVIKQLWHWLFHTKYDEIRVNNEGYSWMKCTRCGWESKGIIISDSKKAS